MQLPPTILVYGREPGLLETRSWVLQVAGFRVASAGDLQEAQVIAEGRDFDLLLLCHTLSMDECRAALAWADTLPHMKRMVLTATRVPPAELWDEQVLSQTVAARELIASIHRLLPAEQRV